MLFERLHPRTVVPERLLHVCGLTQASVASGCTRLGRLFRAAEFQRPVVPVRATRTRRFGENKRPELFQSVIYGSLKPNAVSCELLLEICAACWYSQSRHRLFSRPSHAAVVCAESIRTLTVKQSTICRSQDLPPLPVHRAVFVLLRRFAAPYSAFRSNGARLSNIEFSLFTAHSHGVGELQFPTPPLL